jgi:hypothetical protein
MAVVVEDSAGRLPLINSRQMVDALGGLLSENIHGLAAAPSLASYALHGYCFWSSNRKRFVWAQFGKYSSHLGSYRGGIDLDDSYLVLEFKPQFLEPGEQANDHYNVVLWSPGVRDGFGF